MYPFFSNIVVLNAWSNVENQQIESGFEMLVTVLVRIFQIAGGLGFLFGLAVMGYTVFKMQMNSDNSNGRSDAIKDFKKTIYLTMFLGALVPLWEMFLNIFF